MQQVVGHKLMNLLLPGKTKRKKLIATPAPELIPIIPGSAKSFFVIPCKIAPDNARAIPDSKVIKMRGKRIEYNTNSSLNVPCPNKVATIRSKDKAAGPTINPITTVDKMNRVNTNK